MKARRGESGEVGMARVGRISQLWTAEHTWNMRFFFLILFTHLVLALLGLLSCTGFSLVAASEGCSLVAVHRLLIAVASPSVEHKLWDSWASVPAAGRLSSCGSWALEHGTSSCGAWA